jgi:hypothetical protein
MRILTFLAVGLALSLVAWTIRRLSPPPLLVRRWADDNAFRIVSCEFRMFSKGPFGSRALGRGSSVYRVHVRDQHGEPHIGWVLCIAEWGAGRTEVEWDAQGELNERPNQSLQPTTGRSDV